MNRGKLEYILVFEADLKRTTFQNAAEFAEEASYAAFLRDISTKEKKGYKPISRVHLSSFKGVRREGGCESS